MKAPSKGITYRWKDSECKQATQQNKNIYQRTLAGRKIMYVAAYTVCVTLYQWCIGEVASYVKSVLPSLANLVTAQRMSVQWKRYRLSDNLFFAIVE